MLGLEVRCLLRQLQRSKIISFKKSSPLLSDRSASDLPDMDNSSSAHHHAGTPQRRVELGMNAS
eukprot:747195-Amphidinium_carterae.1